MLLECLNFEWLYPLNSWCIWLLFFFKLKIVLLLWHITLTMSHELLYMYIEVHVYVLCRFTSCDCWGIGGHWPYWIWYREPVSLFICLPYCVEYFLSNVKPFIIFIKSHSSHTYHLRCCPKITLLTLTLLVSEPLPSV